MKGGVLYFISGAPGSGKSTIVERLLERASDYVDMDALIEPASALTSRDIRTAPET